MTKQLFLAAICMALSTQALAESPSFSLESNLYEVPAGSPLVFSVDYDFTDTPIFAGCFDLFYDTGLLEFVDFEHTDFNGLLLSPSNDDSAAGFLVSPGHYSGAGVSASNFFTGVNDAGPVGVFTFNANGNLPDPGSTPCGRTLCLKRTNICPVVSLLGQVIDSETFANGISEADVLVTTADSDGDGVLDHQDNCTEAPNPDQRDTNSDGFGNACDLDWNNDCVVNFSDYILLPPAFNSQTGDASFDPDLDVNGDGNIAFIDVVTFPVYFLKEPGPGNASCSAQ